MGCCFGKKWGIHGGGGAWLGVGEGVGTGRAAFQAVATGEGHMLGAGAEGGIGRVGAGMLKRR